MTGKLTKEETDRFLDVDGIQIHYNEAGTGPAFICTHGGGPGANAWDNTKHAFDALAENFRVILFDCPGYGESQKHVSRNDVPMDIFMAKLFLKFMDQLGIDRAHQYGSSQFGPAALRFGVDYPERTGKIVVQASGIGNSRSGGEPTAGIKSLSTFANNPVRENMEAMMGHFTPRAEFRGPEVVDARFRAAHIPGHLESRALMQSSSNSDLSEDIKKLQTEVLLLWGNEDGMIPAEGALRALSMIPNSRAVIWGDRSGHFVESEHPEEFARIVTDFLTH